MTSGSRTLRPDIASPRTSPDITRAARAGDDRLEEVADAHLSHTWPAPFRLTVSAIALTVALVRMLMPFTGIRTQDARGSNTQPLAFGPDQIIIDLNKLAWVPLKAEGVPPGPDMGVLRGDGKAAGFEVVVRLPAGYTFPNHSHTSDEHDVWLNGDFTYTAADGTATPLSGQTYISLPRGVPHALACGPEPCVYYVRYPQPFDAHVHPMPPLKK